MRTQTTAEQATELPLGTFAIAPGKKKVYNPPKGSLSIDRNVVMKNLTNVFKNGSNLNSLNASIKTARKNRETKKFMGSDRLESTTKYCERIEGLKYSIIYDPHIDKLVVMNHAQEAVLPTKKEVTKFIRDLEKTTNKFVNKHPEQLSRLADNLELIKNKAKKLNSNKQDTSELHHLVYNHCKYLYDVVERNKQLFSEMKADDILNLQNSNPISEYYKKTEEIYKTGGNGAVKSCIVIDLSFSLCELNLSQDEKNGLQAFINDVNSDNKKPLDFITQENTLIAARKLTALQWQQVLFKFNSLEKHTAILDKVNKKLEKPLEAENELSKKVVAKDTVVKTTVEKASENEHDAQTKRPETGEEVYHKVTGKVTGKIFDSQTQFVMELKHKGKPVSHRTSTGRPSAI